MAAFTPDTLRTTIANRGGLATTEKFEISFTDLQMKTLMFFHN